MFLTIVAIILLALTVLVGPVATPIYATVTVNVKNYTIVTGEAVDKFVNIPLVVYIVTGSALLLIAFYIEVVSKTRVDNLPKILALLSALYALPLPYVYLIGVKDVAIVLSNYAKALSLPAFGLALFVAVAESLLMPKKRARVIADLSATEEKTEKGE